MKDKKLKRIKDKRLKQILLKIEKYQLSSVFKENTLNDWLKSLNETQINNFLNVDFDKINLYESCITINWIVDVRFLGSNYYAQDIEMISKAHIKSFIIARCLFNIARNELSINSGYHNEDMNFIFNSKSDKVADRLREIAVSKNSLASEYHREDMNLIADVQSDVIANYLLDIARNIDSLTSVYHREDMNLIANAKSDVIASYLYGLAKYEISLATAYHNEDMNLIANAKSDVIAYYLTIFARDELSLASDDHRLHMEFIASAKNEEEAKKLTEYLILYLNKMTDLNAIPSNTNQSVKQTILLSLIKQEETEIEEIKRKLAK